jgi:hypothetical protein
VWLSFLRQAMSVFYYETFSLHCWCYRICFDSQAIMVQPSPWLIDHIMRKIFPVTIGAIIGAGFGEYQIWKVGLLSSMPWLVVIPPIAFLVVVIVVWKCSKNKNA